jgi:hypothetical protein
MFSKQLRAAEHIEIVYAGEHFVWQEDPAVAEQRQRARKHQTLTLIAGVVLAALVLGNAISIGWLFSSVTEANPSFVAEAH